MYTDIKFQNENLNKLQNFPIMFFAVVMGFGGLCLSYERLNLIFDISHTLGEILKWLTTALFLAITLSYTAKIAKYPKAVKAELAHPIRINFFAAFSISLLLLAAIWKESAIYPFFLYTGIVLQTFFTFYVISFWIQSDLTPTQSNPAWFIPIVGNLIIPVSAPATAQYSWYYFSVGLFFWLVLFIMIFYRVIFHERLVQKFIPTLFILIAPPAIAFLGILKLGGDFGITARILLNLTLFFTLLLVFLFKNFLKLKFFLSWWAFTFPTAAVSMAFLRAFELSESKFWLNTGIATFALLVFFILLVGFYTIKAMLHREICVLEN